MVVFDRFMTGDAVYADIILPGTTNFENLGYQRYAGGYCRLRPKIIEHGGSLSTHAVAPRLEKNRPTEAGKPGSPGRFPQNDEILKALAE